MGFTYKGEWNIPFKFGFTKLGEYKINLHVFEENHPEIELNLLFSDHLRSHPESVSEYAKIKEQLLLEEGSFKKQEGHLFTGYNLGKDAFIRRILEKEGYARHRFLKETHIKEWESYHRIRKEQIFDRTHVVYDPNHPTIHAKGNFHFILCLGMNVVTVAHVEFLNEFEVALRSLATDEPYKKQGLGKTMMELLEKWIKHQGKKVIRLHAASQAEGFYRKLGYFDMPFDDPSIAKETIDLGKILPDFLKTKQ